MDKPYNSSDCFCCVLLVRVPLISAGMWRFHQNVHNPLSWKFAQLLLVVANISWIFQILSHHFFRHDFLSLLCLKRYIITSVEWSILYKLSLFVRFAYSFENQQPAKYLKPLQNTVFTNKVLYLFLVCGKGYLWRF